MAQNVIALVIVQEYLATLVSEMATHSNILAWEVPWIEEPGSLWGRKSQA